HEAWLDSNQARQGELNATQIPAREREQRQRDRGVASEPAVALPPKRDSDLLSRVRGEATAVDHGRRGIISRLRAEDIDTLRAPRRVGRADASIGGPARGRRATFRRFASVRLARIASAGRSSKSWPRSQTPSP